MKRMYLLLLIIVLIVNLCPVSVLSSELDVNQDTKLGLADAIYILRELSGMNVLEPPAVNISGSWKVQSDFYGETRTGMVKLNMSPTGTINGEARLTTLPGKSEIIGKLSGYQIELIVSSDQGGSMSVTGTVNEEGKEVGGNFRVVVEEQEYVIQWGGQKLTTGTINGIYTYNSEAESLTLIYKSSDWYEVSDTPMRNPLSDITEKTMMWNNSKWERDSGVAGNLIGSWVLFGVEINNLVTFRNDGTFEIVQVIGIEQKK